MVLDSVRGMRGPMDGGGAKIQDVSLMHWYSEARNLLSTLILTCHKEEGGGVAGH